MNDALIKEKIKSIKDAIPQHVTLVAVSKFQSIESIKTAYDAGHRDFGENYVQELCNKYEQLPKDIRWHFIGHLQSNKVKYITPFVHLIHSVDNLKLLKEIDKQGSKNNRIINCLIQMYIAQEETKFGCNEDELFNLIQSSELDTYKHVCIKGLMGMASFTNNKSQIEKEFKYIRTLFDKIKNTTSKQNIDCQILSIGMSGDYSIAIECGSTLIRIGTSIFGERKNI